MDFFERFKSGLTSPGSGFFAVTPNDAADLAIFTRGIIVGVAGDVKITDLHGVTTIIPALAAGVIHPIRASRIWAADTAATSIVGVY